MCLSIARVEVGASHHAQVKIPRASATSNTSSSRDGMCTIFGCQQMCSYKKEANSLSTNVLPIVAPIVVARHAILEVVLKSPVIQKLFPYSCLSSYEVLQDEQGLIFSWLGGLDSILHSDPRVVAVLQSDFMVESCLIVKALLAWCWTEGLPDLLSCGTAAHEAVCKSTEKDEIFDPPHDNNGHVLW